MALVIPEIIIAEISTPKIINLISIHSTDFCNISEVSINTMQNLGDISDEIKRKLEVSLVKKITPILSLTSNKKRS